MTFCCKALVSHKRTTSSDIFIQRWRRHWCTSLPKPNAAIRSKMTKHCQNQHTKKHRNNLSSDTKSKRLQPIQLSQAICSLVAPLQVILPTPNTLQSLLSLQARTLQEIRVFRNRKSSSNQIFVPKIWISVLTLNSNLYQIKQKLLKKRKRSTPIPKIWCPLQALWYRHNRKLKASVKQT